MTWEDKTLHWAWRSVKPGPEEPPTTKCLAYATIHTNPPMRMACAVLDDDGVQPVNETELAWWQAQGVEVTL